MSSLSWPAGLVPALVTPFRDDSVHHEGLARLVDSQIEAGVVGLVVGGGTGEFGSLTVDERINLAERVIRQVGDRVPVIVQTGALATRDAVTLSQAAESQGASGILLASPFGEPISWPERVRFYEDLTAAVSLPVMIYNTPPSGLLTLQQLQELSALPNVSAVKDSSGDHELMGDLLAWAQSTDFAVYVGKDSFVYDAIGAGARGAIIGMANFFPAAFVQVIASLQQAGVTPASRDSWRRMRPLIRFMEQSPNYISLCKAGCRLQGFEVGDARRPYLMPDIDEVESLRTLLEEVALVPAGRA